MHELYWYWLQFPQALCNPGANLEAPFYVLMNAGLDHPAEFFMFQRRAVFIDQPPQFIQEEVITSDPIIEIVDGILHTLWVGHKEAQKPICLLCLFVAGSVDTVQNRTSPFAGSIVSILTFIVSPGCCLPAAGRGGSRSTSSCCR